MSHLDNSCFYEALEHHIGLSACFNFSYLWNRPWVCSFSWQNALKCAVKNKCSRDLHWRSSININCSGVTDCWTILMRSHDWVLYCHLCNSSVTSPLYSLFNPTAAHFHFPLLLFSLTSPCHISSFPQNTAPCPSLLCVSHRWSMALWTSIFH